MLQIATGMYFRQGAKLHETTHRATAYSNGFRIDRDAIVLPFATLHFDTSIAPFIPVTIEATDRLEAADDDGQTFGIIATGGAELIDDVAMVLAFTTNTTWSTDRDLVRRLVPPVLSNRPGRGPASQLRRTFDPEIHLTDDDIDDAANFGKQLLALRRPAYEKANRAIRRVVDATLLIADDVTLAYTLYVAALESLAVDSLAQPPTWQNYDGRKRGLIDPVLSLLDGEQAEQVRAAILEADALGLARRFETFTVNHLEPSFYRAEAVEAHRPITRTALPRALQFAYRVRSAQVHALQQLAPEMWAIGDRGDTLRFEGQTVLSLQGLNRLCRHVIRRYVERAPTGVDTSFDYRAALPGHVRIQLAPQYWIWQAAGLTTAQGPERFNGFLELLLPALRRDEGAAMVEMSDVLASIERLLPGEAVAAKRAPLVALYKLWHHYLSIDKHRPKKDALLARFGADLDAPSASAFAVSLLLDDDPPWHTDQLEDFVSERQHRLRSGSAAPLPARIDAALLLCLARRRWREGRQQDAVDAVSAAVETIPGDEGLLRFEETVRNDHAARTAVAAENTEDGQPNGANEADVFEDTVTRPEALVTLDLRTFLFARSADAQGDNSTEADAELNAEDEAAVSVEDGKEDSNTPESEASNAATLIGSDEPANEPQTEHGGPVATELTAAGPSGAD